MFLPALITMTLVSPFASETAFAPANFKEITLWCIQWKNEINDIQKQLIELALDAQTKTSISEAQNNLDKIIKSADTNTDISTDLGKFTLTKIKLYVNITRSSLSRVLTSSIEAGAPEILTLRVYNLSKQVEELGATL